MSQKAKNTKMWYRVRARDNSIYKPVGKVLTFSIWADSDEKFWELMEEKKHTEVEILGKTTEINLK